MDAVYDINGNAVKENDRIRFKSGKEGIVENEIISDKRNCSGTSG